MVGKSLERRSLWPWVALTLLSILVMLGNSLSLAGMRRLAAKGGKPYVMSLALVISDQASLQPDDGGG